MKIIRKIFETLLLIFSILILILAIYTAIQSKKTNKDFFFFGFKPYIIQTGSMEPELKVNALIIIKAVNYEEIEVGDIISFKVDTSDSPIYVCHRVVEKTEQGYITKGDNSNSLDFELITEENFSGKLVFKTNATSVIYENLHSIFKIIQKLFIFIIVIILLYISHKLFISNKTTAKRYKE